MKELIQSLSTDAKVHLAEIFLADIKYAKFSQDELLEITEGLSNIKPESPGAKFLEIITGVENLEQYLRLEIKHHENNPPSTFEIIDTNSFDTAEHDL